MEPEVIKVTVDSAEPDALTTLHKTVKSVD